MTIRKIEFDGKTYEPDLEIRDYVFTLIGITMIKELRNLRKAIQG